MGNQQSDSDSEIEIEDEIEQEKPLFNPEQIKSEQYEEFLNTKLALHEIKHRKIVQKIHRKYIAPSKKILTLKLPNLQFKKLHKQQIKEIAHHQFLLKIHIDFDSISDHIQIIEGKIIYSHKMITRFLRSLLKIEQFNLIFQPSLKNQYNFNYIKNVDNFNISIMQDVNREMESLFDTLKYFSYVKGLQITIKAFVFSNENFDQFCQQIGNFQQLVKLSINLSYNYLINNNLEILFAEIKKLKNLKHLQFNLYGAFVAKKQFQQLSTLISELNNLYELDLNLGKGELDNEGLEILTQHISKNQNIRKLTLNIENSKIIDIEGIQSVADSLSQLETFVDLYINSEEEAKQIQNPNKFIHQSIKQDLIQSLITIDQNKNNLMLLI